MLLSSTSPINRYWVGGTGNSNSTTKWSLLTGGSSGASVPVAGVNAIWDSNSSAGTATINAAFSCRDFDTSTYTGTIAGSSSIACGGSFTLGSSITRSYTGPITMTSTTGGKAVTLNGKTLGAPFIFNGIGGAWAFNGDISSTGNLTVTNGTPDFTNRTITCVTWTVGAGGTPILGGTTINNSGNFQEIRGGGAYNIVNNANTANTTTTLLGSNSFVTYTASSTIFSNLTPTAGTIQTISGAYTLTGANAFDLRFFVNSATIGTATNTVVNGTASITNTDLQDMVFTGSATPISAPGIGNGGRNSGVTFDAPKTVYWIHPATASVSLLTNNCVTTTGGSTPSTQLIQDTINLDANSFGATGKTVAMSTTSGRYPGLNFTAATNTPTLSISAPSFIYGSLTLISGMTLAGSNLLTFSGDTAMNFTTGGQTIPWTLLVDAKNGGVTLQDNLTASSNLNILKGSFDFNNKTIIGLTSIAAAGVGTISLGNITLTLALSSTVWSVTAPYAISAGTSTIKYTYSGTNATGFSGGGQAYNILWNATANTTIFTITDGGNSFATFKADASRSIKFAAGLTNTITTLTLGASCVVSSTTASQATIANASGIAFASIGTTVTNINCTGAGWVVTSGTDGGGNTGVTFI